MPVPDIRPDLINGNSDWTDVCDVHGQGITHHQYRANTPADGCAAQPCSRREKLGDNRSWDLAQNLSEESEEARYNARDSTHV